MKLSPMLTVSQMLFQLMAFVWTMLIVGARADADECNVSAAKWTNSTDATILLITNSELADAWQPFARWKTAIGKQTKIILVEQISGDYEGDIVQEKIRRCVRDHIENHRTRWVILGGDCLPDNKGIVPAGHVTVHRQEPKGIPTDIVYLSDTDWDADGDGVYGEFDDDRTAITYPDGSVGLGRVPVRTVEDVAAYTDKVIAYESNYPTTDFATQMVYTCTERSAYPKVRQSWDGYVSQVWKGDVGRFFSSETPWDEPGRPGSYDLTATNMVELLNKKKIGKIHIHGHGHLPAWVLENSTFTGKHVRQLRHNGAYPLITTVCCFTGQYDSNNDPSIVEQMIRQPKGGSVAIVAPIRTGKPHFADPADFRLMVTEGKLDGTTLTMTRYWMGGLGKGLSTGEALMAAKAEMADDARVSQGYHLCICELNLLGDPSLCMRPEAPRMPVVTIPARIALGAQTIAVDTDAPHCTICLWQGQDVYAVETADEDGKASFSISIDTPGEISVGVSGVHLNAVLGKIECGTNEPQ